MNDSAGYAVFFFPPALEVLGDAIKPYLQDGPAGMHVPCREVDTGGAFIEMTLQGRTDDGHDIALELMVPGNMVRMIVSARSDTEFGFYDRTRAAHVLVEPGLPPADANGAHATAAPVLGTPDAPAAPAVAAAPPVIPAHTPAT